MRWLVFTSLMAAAAGLPAAAPSREAAATIVVYNSGDPASKALAEYYAGKRDIPASQLVGLACPPDEEISRSDFLVDIESPLRARFTKSGWWRIERNENDRRAVTAATIRFVAIMRGVPMKIRPKAVPPTAQDAPNPPPETAAQMLGRHDEASVDSELAALFAPGHDIAGPVENPYYRSFTPVLDVPAAAAPLLVCRLDGPSDAVVRRMIDDSLAAERQGLWGWAYLDERSISSGPYAMGDEWLAATGAILRKQGVPVITDEAPETLPRGFPVTDAALYYGWYEPGVTGPFAEPDFRFVPGAIAVHLHSYSASTLRNARAAWTAPLLAAGAAASMGNVYEPFLELTVHFDVLQDRLLNGLTLAESAYAASRVVSWMGVVVGDPLYRPYASLLSLSADAAPNRWGKYRALILTAGGDPLAAAGSLRELAEATGDSMPLEALGQAQAAGGRVDAALETLSAAARIARKSPVRFRLALEQIDILRHAGRRAEARAKISAALQTFPSSEAQLALGRIVLAITPKPPEPAPGPKP